MVEYRKNRRFFLKIFQNGVMNLKPINAPRSDSGRFRLLARWPSFRARPYLQQEKQHGELSATQIGATIDLSSEEKALLQKIAANSEIDSLRVDHADWLEMNGQSVRAEFILSNLKRTNNESSSEGHIENILLAIRAENLLRQYQSNWLAPWENFGIQNAHWFRGYPSKVQITGRAFISLGEYLLQTLPIESVHLIAVRPLFSELIQQSHLARLKALDLRGNHLGNLLVAQLLKCPFLESITELNLASNSVHPDVHSLFSHDHLHQLNKLNLETNLLGDQLVDCLNFARLQELNIANNRIDDEVAQKIFDHPLFPNLKSISLANNRITSRGVQRLLQREESQLERLNLSGNRFESPLIIKLKQTPILNRLRQLDLDNLNLGDEDLINLTNRGTELPLRKLSIAYNLLGDQSATALGNSAMFTRLVELNLGHNRIGNEGLIALGQSRWLPQLSSLNLENNRLSDNGFKRFCESQILPITKLNLAWNPLSDPSLMAISRAPWSRSLYQLDLTGIDFGYLGAKALIESVHLSPDCQIIIGSQTRLWPDILQMMQSHFRYRLIQKQPYRAK